MKDARNKKRVALVKQDHPCRKEVVLSQIQFRQILADCYEAALFCMFSLQELLSS